MSTRRDGDIPEMEKTCSVCFEGTYGLEPYPYSSWRIECEMCRKIREIEEHKRNRLKRVEEKVDRILELLESEEQ